MKRIVWLASYPKSGNTWFRAFLTNYRRDAGMPVSINDLLGAPIASARHPFDEALGYDSGELTHDEIDVLRPEFYRQQARAAREMVFYKVHDAYTRLPDGSPLLPTDATIAALYFIRDPRDVAVSFAHHAGESDCDARIKFMGDEDCALGAIDAAESTQLRQRLSSWSRHVRSWVDDAECPVHVMRYEDMKQRPEEIFGAAVRFLELGYDAERVRRALDFSRFEEMQRQEERVGFAEKLPRAQSFFRAGQTGAWRLQLNPEQAARLVADHGEIMRRFGYLDASAP
jgi:hypothetical protein